MLNILSTTLFPNLYSKHLLACPHRVGGNGKRSSQSTKADQKAIVGRQMTIVNSVSNDFLSTFIDSIDDFYCRVPGVMLQAEWK